jgi:hypothetical protein
MSATMKCPLQKNKRNRGHCILCSPFSKYKGARGFVSECAFKIPRIEGDLADLLEYSFLYFNSAES